MQIINKIFIIILLEQPYGEMLNGIMTYLYDKKKSHSLLKACFQRPQ